MSKSKMLKIKTIENTTKVVIAKYIRVSTDKQREEGYSVDIQKERLDAYARSMFSANQYNIEYREYVDDGFSGGSLNRPRINQLIQDVKNGEITHIIVLKLDRLSRSQKDTLYLIEDVFLPNNVAFISMNESFNTATPFGRAVIGILSVFAQLERENIFERTRSGMQKRVELGYWPGGGRIPFGYDYDAQQGILVQNQDAETVRKIYDLYLQGYALQAIADMCNLKYERLAQQILTRKSNVGVITYNGKEYQGRHEPIISLDTYQKAMTMLHERSNKRFVSKTNHLFTGLIYCGKCGSKMRYQKWGKTGYKLICYSQQTSKPYLVKDPNCDNKRPWAGEIEGIVLEILFKRATQKIENEIQKESGESVLHILKNQKNLLAKKLKRLYNLYAENGDDILLETIHDTQKEISEIDKKITLEDEKSAITQEAYATQMKLDTLCDCWDYMTVTEQQNIVRSVMNKIVITDNHVHVDFKY